MTTPIVMDPAQWFDGLRPDARWHLRDPGQPAAPAQPSGFGKAPAPEPESITAFMQRIGIRGGPAPVFGDDPDPED